MNEQEERRLDPAKPPVCQICGAPMPEGEEMFKFHGFSGPCPVPKLPRPRSAEEAIGEAESLLQETFDRLDPENDRRDAWFLERITKIREALADHRKLTDTLRA